MMIGRPILLAANLYLQRAEGSDIVISISRTMQNMDLCKNNYRTIAGYSSTEILIFIL